jgi:hypothetical protein
VAVPVFVGAGSGAAILTGSGTVSKTSCTAGNLIIVHFIVRGTTYDWSAFSNETNIEALDGTPNTLENIRNSEEGGHFIGRVTANGTCSADATVGASGEDIFLRMYEFSGAATGTTVATVLENDTGVWDGSSATGTTVGDAIVTTNGGDRLALNFVQISSNLATTDFTGETGGDWTEAVAEYQDATGATATLQLQTASMVSSGTIEGGSYTIGSSVLWTSVGTAIIPAAPAAGSVTLRTVRSSLRW